MSENAKHITPADIEKFFELVVRPVDRWKAPDDWIFFNGLRTEIKNLVYMGLNLVHENCIQVEKEAIKRSNIISNGKNNCIIPSCRLDYPHNSYAHQNQTSKRTYDSGKSIEKLPVLTSPEGYHRKAPLFKPIEHCRSVDTFRGESTI